VSGYGSATSSEARYGSSPQGSPERHRPGTTAGIWLVAAYTAFTAITALSFGIFTTTLLQSTSWPSALQWLPFLLAFAVLPITACVASRPMRTLGNLLLVLEGITMAAILVVSVLTMLALVTKGGPEEQSVDWSVFRIEGASAGAIALALTFALLSSAGFDGLATLGDETANPWRTIPWALLWTVVMTSSFYIFVTTVAVWAFGLGSTAMAQFDASGLLPAEMANLYVGHGTADLIRAGGCYLVVRLYGQWPGRGRTHHFGPGPSRGVPLAPRSALAPGDVDSREPSRRDWRVRLCGVCLAGDRGFVLLGIRAHQ